MRTLIALVVLASPALASSEDAWDAFRADVLAKCQSLVPPGVTATVEVNPFGSERFGAAIVTTRGPAGDERAVCIYDKRSQAAELTAPFAEPQEAAGPAAQDSPEGSFGGFPR